MTPAEAEEVSRALVVWTGWDETSWPKPDDARVAERMGAETASRLAPVLRELRAEFYATDVGHARTMAERCDLLVARFRDLHPELSDAAVDALRWCYTFDYR